MPKPINRSAEETVDSMEKLGASSQALSAMAVQLGGLVGRFKASSRSDPQASYPSGRRKDGAES